MSQHHWPGASGASLGRGPFARLLRGGSRQGAPASSASSASPASPVDVGEYRLTLLPGMPRVIEAIERDVAESTRRVMVETYVYHDRKFGRSFARQLAKAARRGAEVRLLYDALGSHVARAVFFERLTKVGVETRAYRPLDVALRQGAPFPRDHSRVIVTDRAAYTGGAAWADNWLPRRLGGEGWYDVCLRVEGPLVEDFATLFEQRWREANGDALPADFTTGDRHAGLELVGDTPDRVSLVEDRYREAIRGARRRIWIENAYFLPPRAILSELLDAARRGVDVQIIVPGRTDLPIIKRGARFETPAWLDSGLHLFEYQSTYLHSKLALADDDWCTVGSFNMNPSSTVWANEVALFVRDPAFVAHVAAQFEVDRAGSLPVRRGEADARRPLRERALDYLASRVVRLLDRGERFFAL